MNGSNYLLKVVFPCRGENCKKSFSKKSNRNKHEKLKNDGPQLQEKIPRALTIFTANGCDVEFKYEHSLVKHLKMCVELKKKRNPVDKAYPVCSKVFA